MREVPWQLVTADLYAWLRVIRDTRESVVLVATDGTRLVDLLPKPRGGILLRRLVDTTLAVLVAERVELLLSELTEGDHADDRAGR